MTLGITWRWTREVCYATNQEYTAKLSFVINLLHGTEESFHLWYELSLCSLYRNVVKCGRKNFARMPRDYSSVNKKSFAKNLRNHSRQKRFVKQLKLSLRCSHFSSSVSSPLSTTIFRKWSMENPLNKQWESFHFAAYSITLRASEEEKFQNELDELATTVWMECESTKTGKKLTLDQLKSFLLAEKYLSLSVRFRYSSTSL